MRVSRAFPVMKHCKYVGVGIPEGVTECAAVTLTFPFTENWSFSHYKPLKMDVTKPCTRRFIHRCLSWE